METGVPFPVAWELYDMEADRIELHDLAAKEPARLRRMADQYEEWAKKIGVQPWPMPETPGGERTGAMPTPRYLKQL